MLKNQAGQNQRSWIASGTSPIQKNKTHMPHSVYTVLLCDSISHLLSWI